MNKADLISSVAEQSGLSKVDSEKAINSFIGTISNELSSGNKITLVGFGTFETADRAARPGKNPKTGEVIQIAAKRVAKFKAGKALANTVNNK